MSRPRTIIGYIVLTLLGLAAFVAVAAPEHDAYGARPRTTPPTTIRLRPHPEPARRKAVAHAPASPAPVVTAPAPAPAITAPPPAPAVAVPPPAPVVTAPAPAPVVTVPPPAPAVTAPAPAPVVTVATRELPIPTSGALPTPVPNPPDPYAPGSLIQVAAIRIPRIGLVAPVYEGVTLTVIDHGPGHWPGTARPGEWGNVVLGGHRTTYSQPFLNLDLLLPGDQIIFDQPGTEATYNVTGTQIVPETAGWIVDQTPGTTVTLFACHPKGSYAQRIVVRGNLVSLLAH